MGKWQEAVPNRIAADGVTVNTEAIDRLFADGKVVDQ